MLERLALACHRHRWRTIAAWAVIVVAVSVAAGVLGGAYAEDGRLPGTDSQAAYDLVAADAGAAQGDTATVVLAGDLGDPAVAGAIDRYLDDVATLPGVRGVRSPLEHPEQVAPGGDVAFAGVDVALGIDEQTLDELTGTMQERAADLAAAGVDTSFGGWMFQEFEMPASEGFGLLAAVVILLLAFGSVVAMGVPIGTALFGIGASLAGVALWAAVVTTPGFTVQVATMIGLGVGIDYALFIVTRYRTALARGAGPEAAVAEAIGTAGRAVVFAGGTVVVSLLGLLVVGLSFLQGLALGTATAVLVAVLAALTLLPALLGLVGHRIDRWSVHRRRRDGPARPTLAHRWSEVVQRHPVTALVIGGGVLVALALPAFAMRLALADSGNDAQGTTTRTAYDTLAGAFGPGVNGPLLVVVETPDAAAVAGLPALRDAVAATPGVAFASPVDQSPSGAIATFAAYPTTAPQDEATDALVRHLRDDVIPASGAAAHVGGATASGIDFATVMGERLPWFVGSVLVLSFVLLLLVFRSVLVPLKAVLMNLLSIAAAYGTMVAVFQWGWLGGLVGITDGAPIEPWAPMMLFAIVFGLSMDYEVFLLSSVRERWTATGDGRRSVSEGLSSTARVITAAAAIMVCVFGSFVVADARPLKLIGAGLAAAVLIDATLVRLVLVPATMELLGARNWWLPRWLDRLLPQVHVERPHAAPAARPWAPPRPAPVAPPAVSRVGEER